MTKLLILDKDGTLVRPASGAKFVQSPEDQELLPGVAEALARYHADGWVMAIASNQGGVAAGYKTLDDAIDEMRYCLRLLDYSPRSLAAHDSWIRLKGYFCPNAGESCVQVHAWHPCGCGLYSVIDRKDEEYPSAKGVWANFRKPDFGMIDLAVDYAQALSQEAIKDILFVGDRPEDEGAAKSAGVQFMWADDWRNP